MKGRKAELKALEGGLSGVPKPPSHLSAVARDEWNRVAPELVRMGILATSDLGALELYTVEFAAIRECEEILREEGRTVTTPAGPKAHPAAAMRKASMMQATRLASELGLTPVSRSRKGIGSPKGGPHENAPAGLDL